MMLLIMLFLLLKNNFKVSRKADDRAYLGLSAGGVASSTVMELEPDSFGAFGIVSAATQVEESTFTDELIAKLKNKENLFICRNS